MSELSSALFSIADDNGFRFARFYIVCEAVPPGAPESPLIVCGLPDMPRGTVQTWKDLVRDYACVWAVSVSSVPFFHLLNFSTTAS